MKIGVKMIIFWIASLALYASAGVVSWLYPDWLRGGQGLFISIFLGYCGIIVVAQAFALLEVIRRQRGNSSEEIRSYDTEIESA